MDSFDNSEKQKLSWGQKGGVIVLVLLGLLVLIAWFVDFNKSIREPAVISENNNTPSSPEKESLCVSGDCSEEGGAPERDTDNDGLSDKEEINTYGTSPYLKDTDSDGINDKEEVERGSDPNCPQGDNCGGSNIITNSEAEGRENSSQLNFSSGSVSTSTLNSELSKDSFSDLGLGATSSLNNNEEVQNVIQGEGDPKTLRKMLLQAGMSRDMLDQIS
ncbi:MAG TPA: thrombospondin type 3 repeat-containing protein, partial [Patescibacteria group bacterium]|nr:thrombospondin type 3 repeat-containing protein [Patescibacteria group bacterium]